MLRASRATSQPLRPPGADLSSEFAGSTSSPVAGPSDPSRRSPRRAGSGGRVSYYAVVVRRSSPRGGAAARWARYGLGLLIALAIGVAVPIRASAHSVLVTSQPASGAQLGTTPGTVVLDFSSPLNAPLSAATVTDPLGHPTTARPTTATEIRVNLVTNAPGQYRVEWTSVSLVDGHTLHGTFGFTVLARGLAAALATSQGGLSAGDVGLALARWVEDAALLLAIGMLLVRWLGRRDPALAWARPRLLLPLVVAVAAGVSVISAESLTASGGSLSGAISYFEAGPTGVARLARVVLEVYAVAAVAGGARIVWPAVAAPVIALAAAGHGAGAQPAWWGVGVDAVHLVAAGAWAGGIVALATVRPPAGWRTEGRALLTRFTPWALIAFGTTVSFGALQALQDVGALDALTGSEYGRVLLVKVGLVGLMLPFSVVAWRLRRPRPRVEGGIAIVVVGAAALLASFPLPVSRLAAAAPVQSPTVVAGLPSGSELTLGEHAGSVLVGLTVDPATPGTNRLLVYTESLRGDDASAALQVSAAVDASTLALGTCGSACHQASATLRGGEMVTVHVAGSEGGTATFALPALPLASGSALLSTAQARMDGLRSYTEHETLTSGGPIITADYTAVAPDRLSWGVDNRSTTIWIGTTQYSRDTPSAPWVTQSAGLTPAVPSYVWDSFSPYVGVHTVGSAVVDGVPSTMVSFFWSSSATPVWFKLWIDSGGLVHRAEMRGPGHFMNETFTNFNAPLAIAAPR